MLINAINNLSFELALLIFGLASWRVGFFIANEDGPFSFMDTLRYALGVRFDEYNNRIGKNTFADGLICVYCNTLWISLFWIILYSISASIAVLLALPFAVGAIALITHKAGA